ncbi:Uncharacterised protein [Mycobacteroides abscessus subsp. abscessus]|nr:Uncharacterised protein [Mycobacteroides abscessus subsp. abscessus]
MPLASHHSAIASSWPASMIVPVGLAGLATMRPAGTRPSACTTASSMATVG